MVLAGKKRKHPTVSVEKDVSVKLTGKLHHGLKEVRKAAKKTKAFETQRLVKKLKELRKSVHDPEAVPEGLEDFENQLKSLKNTDHERIAYLALSSKIRKDKILSPNDTLVSALTSATPRTEVQHVKVESRLLSSKFLAAEVASIVNGLREILVPDATSGVGGDSRRRIGPGPIVDGLLDEASEGEIAVNVAVSSGDDDYDAQEVDSGEALIPDQVVDEADDVVDDDGWESGSVGNGRQTDSDDDNATSSEPPRKRQKGVLSTQPNIASSDQGKSATASTFLPSLSVGYIRGDSDSDLSEGETTTTGRKNRRGQRARQAIWEKKYGKNAKHVKKQREEAEAVATARALGKRPDKGWAGNRQRHATGAKLVHKPKPAHGESDGIQPSEKPFHPSWEAKKKLKEKERAHILPSQGKKIVFGQ